MSDDDEKENIFKLISPVKEENEESDLNPLDLQQDIADIIHDKYGHLTPEEVLGTLTIFISVMTDAIKYHYNMEVDDE